MPEVKGDGKIRFGCNYRRLHVYTQSDVEVSADKFVSATLVYLNNTNHVPVRWQRRLADPAILEAKDIRHRIIDTNGIRIDMEDRAIVKKNLFMRIRGWQKVLRMCRDFQANLNDVLTICPDTSEDNMHLMVDAMRDVINQTTRMMKSEVKTYNGMITNK